MSERKYGVCLGLDGHLVDGSPGEMLMANPQCRCSAQAAMFCPFGHMLECHFPMTCEEAECQHWQQAQEEGAV